MLDMEYSPFHLSAIFSIAPLLLGLKLPTIAAVAQANDIFFSYFGIWFVLSILISAFFWFNKNAALKRRLWPPVMILSAFLFLFFISQMGENAPSLFIMTPLAALAAFLNIRGVRFCSECGKIHLPKSLFFPPKYCLKCGADLDSKDD